MREPFEEIAGREMNALYQAALFLSAGDERGAERLLVDTVRASADAYRTGSVDPDTTAWLQTRIVERFLGSHTRPSEPPASGRTGREALREVARAVRDLPELEIGARVYRAAGSIPPLGRAVIWLVVFRRWRYDGVTAFLGIGRDVVVSMLRYRDALVAAALEPGSSARRAVN